MDNKPVFTLFFCVLINLFWGNLSLYAEASSPEVEIKLAKPPYEANGILQFDIMVKNPSERDLVIKVAEGLPPFDFKIADQPTWKQTEISYSATSSIKIEKGSEKIIASFDQDLKKIPLSEEQKIDLKVWVNGVGEQTLSVDLKKPGFLEGVLKNLLADKGKRDVRDEKRLDSQDAVIARSASDEAISDLEIVSPPVGARNDMTAAAESLVPKSQPQQQVPDPESEPTIPQETMEQNSEPAAEPTNPAPLASETSPEPVLPPAPAPIFFPVDATPPATPTVNSLPQYIQWDTFALEGTKEANSSIWINGEEKVATDNATTWRWVATLNEGTNLFRVESRDVAGNISSPVIVSMNRDSIDPQIQSVTVLSTSAYSASIEVRASEPVAAALTYEKRGTAQPQTVVMPEPYTVSDIMTYLTLSNMSLQSSYTFTLNNLEPETDYDFYIWVWDKASSATPTNSTLSFKTQATGNPFEEPIIENLSFHNGAFIYFPFFCCRTLGDLNGDGIEEYALFDIPNGENGRLIVPYTESDGTVGEDIGAYEVPYKDLYFRYLMPAGDFNGDGSTDVVLGGRQGSFLLKSRMENGKVIYELDQTIEDKTDNHGVGEYPTLPYYFSEGPADFNGDGLKDLLTMSQDSWDVGGTLVHSHKHYVVFSNATSGRYGTLAQAAVLDLDIQPSYPLNFYELTSFSDVNGDGLPEILRTLKVEEGASVKTQFRIYPSPSFSQASSWDVGEIEGYFWQKSTSSPVGSVDVGDLDGDGIKELFGHLDVTQPLQYALVYFDNTGSFKKIEMLDLGIIYQVFRIEDLNQDGISEGVFLTAPDNTHTQDQIQIFYSKNGEFNFAAAPDVVLNVPPYGGNASHHLFVRKRVVGGQTKHDLILHAIQSDTNLTYMDVIWKEK